MAPDSTIGSVSSFQLEDSLCRNNIQSGPPVRDDHNSLLDDTLDLYIQIHPAASLNHACMLDFHEVLIH